MLPTVTLTTVPVGCAGGAAVIILSELMVTLVAESVPNFTDRG